MHYCSIDQCANVFLIFLSIFYFSLSQVVTTMILSIVAAVFSIGPLTQGSIGIASQKHCEWDDNYYVYECHYPAVSITAMNFALVFYLLYLFVYFIDFYCGLQKHNIKIVQSSPQFIFPTACLAETRPYAFYFRSNNPKQ